MDNKSQVAGILSIVSGAFGFLGAGSMLLVIRLVEAIIERDMNYPHAVIGFMTFFYSVWGVFLALLAILAVVGGVYALKKKHWGVALAGSIASIFTFFPCGVAAVVIMALAKAEFNRPLLPPQPPVQQ